MLYSCPRLSLFFRKLRSSNQTLLSLATEGQQTGHHSTTFTLDSNMCDAKSVLLFFVLLLHTTSAMMLRAGLCTLRKYRTALTLNSDLLLPTTNRPGPWIVKESDKNGRFTLGTKDKYIGGTPDSELTLVPLVQDAIQWEPYYSPSSQTQMYLRVASSSSSTAGAANGFLGNDFKTTKVSIHQTEKLSIIWVTNCIIILKRFLCITAFR